MNELQKLSTKKTEVPLDPSLKFENFLTLILNDDLIQQVTLTTILLSSKD